MIILDAGPLYAAADTSDSHHAQCAALLRTASGPFVLPAPVINEVCFWLGKRMDALREATFLRSVAAGEYDVAVPEPGDYTRAAVLVEQYGDSDLGFVDAMVVATAERLRARRVATVDHRHFRMVRPAHVAAFELLP